MYQVIQTTVFNCIPQISMFPLACNCKLNQFQEQCFKNKPRQWMQLYQKYSVMNHLYAKPWQFIAACNII
jgi:hypothetical protein